MEAKVRIWRDPSSDAYRAVFIERLGFDKLYRKLDGSGTLKGEAGTAAPEGTVLCLGDESFLQLLADELHRHGFTPRAHVPSKTELDAKDDHIDDLRRIAFAALKIKEPSPTLRRVDTAPLM